MHNKSTSRADLTDAFKVLQSEFDSRKNDIKHKEAEFDQQRKKFIQQFNIRGTNLDRLIGQNNPLQPLAHGLTEQFKEIFAGWERQVTARSKGTKFREGFGDSLLVFIYGKVKSGKSSLGNYMAWGHSEPTPEMKQNALQPTYFSAEQTQVEGGDKAQEAEANLEFRVNATEATSSIQGFKLPGLTWIDSPGLHSVNAINGDLAKEYAEHADLILYTMNSQAPGRASDMTEIKDLLNSNKKLMLLLTGSDTTDEDEDEDGNIITLTVMKDPVDRQAQIEHVRNELKELSNSSNVLAEVLPVSTRYAELNPTSGGLIDSGMGQLMYELKTICTSQALAIKLNTPMENLRNSIRLTTSDLTGTAEIINNFAKNISKQNEVLDRELNSLGVQGASQMRTYINQIFDNDQKSDLEGALRIKAGEIISQLALDAFNKIGESQQQEFKQAFDSSRLAALPEYQEIIEEKDYLIGTTKSNKSLFGAMGATIGGIVGLAVAGPVGAAIGASLGSSASIAGDSASTEYGKHNVVVGDNREDQRQSAIENYSTTLPALLTEYVNSLYDPLRTGMLEYCTALESDMNKLMLTFQKLSEVNQ